MAELNPQSRPAPTPRNGTRWTILMGVLLAILTGLVYQDSLANGFVDFDDNGYVTDNPLVLQGLTAESIQYACTTFDLGNWIPLTWLSFELDVTLWGLNASAMHRTDLVLHTISVLLIYVFLNRATGSRLTSAVAAALWGLHPLRVESVAWIAERKDTLSTCLMLTGLCCYERYVSTSRRAWYAGLLVSFILGLLAKSMLVTLPLLLIGLDLWPLRRTIPNATSRFAWLKFELWEKLPLLLISLVFGLITILAQRSQLAVASLEEQSLLARIPHAIESYGWYLWTTFNPVYLSPFYPLNPGEIDFSMLALGVLSLTAFVTLAIVRRRTEPWLALGTLWWIVALLPVIGLIQVGSQAYADRYTYLPSIGLTIMLVWQLDEWLSQLPRGREIKVLLVVAAIGFLSQLTSLQVVYWNNPRSLWSRVQERDPDNWLANMHRGRIALKENDGETALLHFQQVVEQRPQYTDAYLMIAGIFQQRQQWVMARRYYEAALKVDPNLTIATINLAITARNQRQFDEARQLLDSCLNQRPFASKAYLELGHVEMEQGRFREGLSAFDAAIQAEPRTEMAYVFAAATCEKLAQPDQGIERLRNGVQVLPRSVPIRLQLAQMLYARGEKAAAIEQLDQAIQNHPANLQLQNLRKTLSQ